MEMKKYDDRIAKEYTPSNRSYQQLPTFASLDEEIEFFQNFPYSKYNFY